MAKVASTQDPWKRLVEWFAKIDLLKKEIEELERLKSAPTSVAVSTFLLKCQLVEFELRQLIFLFDLHLRKQNASPILKIKLRTPKDLEDLTLGKLVAEFDRFEGGGLTNLKQSLHSLNSLRKDFVHHLFDPGKPFGELNKDAHAGVGIVNNVLADFKKLEDTLRTY